KCGFRTRRVSARCECWCGTGVLHPVDELVLVLPRALWRRCRSRGRHLRERRSWERRAPARCECWCGTWVLHPVDELVLVLPRARWRRCRSARRHRRECRFWARRASARCECWCGTGVLHPVDELVLVLPRALWRRCRSRGRHLRERRSWERRAPARRECWRGTGVLHPWTSWCSMRWAPPSPFYSADARRDRCYAATGTERRQEETMNQSMSIGIGLAKHVFFVAALDGAGKPPRRNEL